MNIQERIAAIVEKRRARLPDVRNLIQQWELMDQDLVALASAVGDLCAHPRTPAEVRQSMAAVSIDGARTGIVQAVELLRLLEARFSRGTINIGVSGRARVGKSTLLQSVSGLSNEQIPTGSGLPVTAVRSRIFHSSAYSRAKLALHTFATFRKEVLEPYHNELGLPGIPVSTTEFKNYSYPRSENELSQAYRDKHSNVAILRRLREMQQALWSYENDLAGGERLIELSQLRQYVAYPTNEEIESAQCARRYLAVRDVRIECAFPYAQVEHVGIVDLPGLGEVASNAEQHHLAGLQNDVDVVLLVKRPVEGMAYWGREDVNTTNLLDSARGLISQRRDFVFILINRGPDDQQLAESMRDDIRRQANDGTNGAHFQVLEADVTDQRVVYEKVLAPVLDHLAERLPCMDQEVLEGTHASSVMAASGIRTVLGDIETALSASRTASVSTVEELGQRSEELRKDLAAAFAELVSDLKHTARSGDEDPAFLSAVDTAYQDICAWITRGFGVGKDVWIANALREMRVDKYSHRFTGDELNRIRVEISGRYCALDNYFDDKVEGLWGQVTGILRRHLGLLVEDVESADALDRLAGCLEEAVEPCPNLAKAIRELRALRLDYRTQLHPRVRRTLDGLNLQVVNPKTGEQETLIAEEVSEDGAEAVYREVTQLAEQAAYQTYKGLIQEALTPALVLYAALEQFEDTLIRAGASRLEFGRLARSCRDDIWPGVYEDMEQTNARVNRVRRMVTAVRMDLGNIERGVA